jgi:predicted RNA binding protein YcfA (HicA-like mRNA interferase family)
VAKLQSTWSVGRFEANRLERKEHKGSSHVQLERDNWPEYTFAFHDSDEIGPKMMARIAKHTGLRPNDL